MSIRYLYAHRLNFATLGDDYIGDFLETTFDTTPSKVIGSFNAFTIEAPEDHVFICEAVRHTSGYWQLGIKKNIRTEKSITGSNVNVLDYSLTVSQISFAGDLVKTVDLPFPEPSVANSDASGLVAGDMVYRNGLRRGEIDYSANTLGGPTFELEEGIFDSATPIGRGGGDGLAQVGFPAWAWIGAADAPVHGLLLLGDWLIPQLDSAISVIAYNLVTEELVTIVNGYDEIPGALAAYESTVHEVGAYPWDTTEQNFFPGLAYEGKRYSVIGHVKDDKSFMVHVARSKYADQFHSNMRRDFTWDYGLSPYMSSYSGLAVSTVIAGEAYSTSFAAKWVMGEGGYGNVSGDDDIWGPWSGVPRGIGAPSYSIATSPSCGDLFCHPTRTIAFNTSPPGTEPLVTTSELTPGDSAAILHSDMIADLEEAFDYAEFGGAALHDADFWWEEYEINDDNDGFNLISTHVEKEEIDPNWTNGDYTYRGPSIAVTEEASSVLGLQVEDFEEDSDLYEDFLRLRTLPLPGYLGHGGDGNSWNLGRGHAVHYCTGNATFTVEEGERVFTDDGDPGDNKSFVSYSAHSGSCAGFPGQPDHEYLPTLSNCPGCLINIASYFVMSTRCYSPIAEEGLISYQKPLRCHSGKYATNGDVRVHFPRARTGSGNALAHVPNVEDVLEHNTETRRLHQIVGYKRVIPEDPGGGPPPLQEWEESWAVNTQDLVGADFYEDTGFINTRHGDCISNPVMTKNFVYCILYGADGIFVAKIAHSDVRIGTALIYAAGTVVDLHKFAEEDELSEVLVNPHYFTFNNFLPRNRKFMILSAAGYGVLDEPPEVE